jgi:hypothetical protein
MQNISKRESLERLAIAVAFLIALLLVVLYMPRKGDIVVYDCRISEISPDFPIEVRNQCRSLRANNLKENLQKPK